MSNTHLRAASVFSLLLGIVMVLGNSATILQGKLTGYGPTPQSSLSGVGSTVLDRPEVQGEMLLPFHGAALPKEPLIAEATTQLLIGMMLMLLGFLLYSLALIRGKQVRKGHVHVIREEVEVPIRIKRRKPAFYWMEIRI